MTSSDRSCQLQFACAASKSISNRYEEGIQYFLNSQGQGHPHRGRTEMFSKSFAEIKTYAGPNTEYRLFRHIAYRFQPAGITSKSILAVAINRLAVTCKLKHRV